jgi:galactokinase
MALSIETMRDSFESVYGRDAAGAVRAPGRVNLIGEHTDYNDGFVLPIAIERETVCLWAPGDSRTLRMASMEAPLPARVDMDAPIVPGEPKWANYGRGVAALLLARGVPLVGTDLFFGSDVPVGGGLSSSAALEVACALALLASAGMPDAVAGRELALLCQRAENEYAASPCGIMDQSVVAMARAGNAMLLDCRGGEVCHVPLADPNMVILVADTRVRHEIAGGAYADRRSACHQAAAAMGIRALRDADEAAIDHAFSAGRLTPKQADRARHVIRENARALRAAEALQAGDYTAAGRLFHESHDSLRDLYEVSCPELDAIVDISRGLPGVYGARMTGGGFGGCAILLADSARAEAVAETVSAGFENRFGRRCPIFATRPAQGAGLLR